MSPFRETSGAGAEEGSKRKESKLLKSGTMKVGDVVLTFTAALRESERCTKAVGKEARAADSPIPNRSAVTTTT